MCAFHDSLLSLESSCCSVYLERLSVDVMNVCRRCTKNKCIPKLYSVDMVDSNMDPGPVPVELIVSFAVILYLLSLANWLNKVWQIQ